MEPTILQVNQENAAKAQQTTLLKAVVRAVAKPVEKAWGKPAVILHHRPAVQALLRNPAAQVQEALQSALQHH